MFGRSAMLVVPAVMAALALAPAAQGASSYRACGNLQFTPNSGDALVRIKASGLSCSSARSTLTKWRKAKYRPVNGPSGWKCTSKGFPQQFKCSRGSMRMRFLGGT